MTVICCWFDQSFGRKRITAIADSRAAKKINGIWSPLQETTLKIYKISVACHQLDSLDTSTGSWTAPYFQTQIGICFAGYCFEALTIIGLFSRCVEQLVVDGTDQPVPEPKKIAGLLCEVTKRYFADHKDTGQQDVEFLMFGFAHSDGEPWVAKVTHTATAGATFAEWEYPLLATSLFTGGDVGNGISKKVNDIRARIDKHARALDPKKFDDLFNYDLEIARHRQGDKKYVEDSALREIDNDLSATVGGILQKAELFLVTCNNSALLTFCRDDKSDMLDGLPEVAPRLGFVPVIERLGS